MKKTRHHLTAPPGMVQTIACEEQARLLRAYCEARFSIGPSATGPHAVTGETFTELTHHLTGGFASPLAARRAAEEHLDRYAADKTGTLYWRVVPEIAYSSRRRKFAYYMRLLISAKDKL